MVKLALILGIYSYLILALGLLGGLYRLPVFIVSLPFIVLLVFWLRKNLYFLNHLEWLKREAKKDKLVGLVLGVLIIQAVVNFLGAVSPELSFDALWYHLTPVKLYVQNHQIFHIPGWLLSVASTPRLTEMFYTVSLLFGNEILAKLIHFSFGLLSAVALFRLLRRYLDLRFSFLGVAVFYTMLIVGWQSTTAYVELSRTFFEILALDFFLQWVETKKASFLLEAAVLTGLAISAKILAFGTLFTFLILIIILKKRGFFWPFLKFAGLAVLVVSPWLFLAWVNTGNPLFPLFGGPKDPTNFIVSPDLNWIIDRFTKMPLYLWNSTLYPDDIISPVYLIFLPLILIFIWRQKFSIKIAAAYVVLGVFFAPANSNRYLLPYLPGLTLVVMSVFNDKWGKNGWVRNFLIFIILFAVLLNLGSRVLATRKFVPYLLRRETKAEFLTNHLNFSFGDFYDVDGFFARNIKKTDLVLVYGVHNLYYLDFPYIHESWARPGTYFTHILVGDNQPLPEKFGERLLIYKNLKTGVRLYLFGEKYQ